MGSFSTLRLYGASYLILLFDLLVTYNTISLSKEFIHIIFLHCYSFVFLFWVEESWIGEFTVVEFGVEVALNLFGSSQEVIEVDGVGAVKVNVVLEVLEHVHVIVGESVSSDSWEGESVVVEFPSVNFEAWSRGSVFTHGFGNVLCVGPVSGIESSGEHVNLVVELILSFVKINAWILELDELIITRAGVFLIIILVGLILCWFNGFGISVSRSVNSNELVIWDCDA